MAMSHPAVNSQSIFEYEYQYDGIESPVQVLKLGYGNCVFVMGLCPKSVVAIISSADKRDNFFMLLVIDAKLIFKSIITIGFCI